MTDSPTDTEILAVLERDDADTFSRMMDEGLDPRAEFDTAEEITLLQVAIREDAVQCVRQMLSRRGDWTLANTPLCEDFESPLAYAINHGSYATLLAFAEKEIVGTHSKKWLRDALIELPFRPSSHATLAVLEAADARPSGLTLLLSDLQVARSLLSGAEEARKGAERGTRARWKEVEKSLPSSE